MDLRDAAVGERSEKDRSLWNGQVGRLGRERGRDDGSRQAHCRIGRVELTVRDVTRKNSTGYRVWSAGQWNPAWISDAEGALAVSAIGRIGEPWTTKPVVERNAEWKAHRRSIGGHRTGIVVPIQKRAALGRIKNGRASQGVRLTSGNRRLGQIGPREIAR